MVRSTETCPAPYGNVEVNDLGMVQWSPSTRPTYALQLHATSHRWTPPPDLQSELCPGFSIDLRSYTDSDGMRRFLPVDGVDNFIDRAFLAGLTILTRDRQLTWEHASVYRAMKLICERVRRMQEHMDREFNFSRDLHIRPSVRNDDGQRTVLPDHVGRTETGAGRSWNARILREEGRARAREVGVERFTARVEIACGLLVAAERNPLELEDSEVPSLVRMALFAPADEDEPLSDECIDEVFGRLMDLLNAHRHDSEDEYQRWYAGPSSNLFRAIAGRGMTTSVVRKAMLQLGWQAYEYVTNCVSYFIQAFVRSLPQPMTADERELLGHMYQPQPYLGGLPMIFLLERQQFIAPVIGRLWESLGDAQTIRVLHRLLDYYREMAIDRRRVDLTSAHRRAHREITHTDLADSQAVAVEGDRTEQMLERIVERRELGCDQCNRRPESAFSSRQQLRTEDGWVGVEYWCQDHGDRCEIQVPLSEIRDIAYELGIHEPV